MKDVFTLYDSGIDYRREIKWNMDKTREHFEREGLSTDTIDKDEKDMLNVLGYVEEGDIASAVSYISNLDTIIRDQFVLMMERSSGNMFVSWDLVE